jgi:hypothetical protein
VCTALTPSHESRKTLTYFHYADDARSTIPIVFLYDFGGEDDPEAFRTIPPL